MGYNISNRKYRFNITNSIKWVVLGIFALTPIFTIQESLALIFGGLSSQIEIMTPLYIKLIKDLSFIVLIFLSTVYIFYSKKILKINLFIILYTVLLLLIAYLFKDDLNIYLAGVRWIMPLILVFLLTPFITKDIIEKIFYVGFYLFCLHFLLQIFQLFFAVHWFGVNRFGLSARNPGVFSMPNTSAFFTIMILFLSMFYAKNLKLKNIIFTLAPISIFLTASGTGVTVYIAIVCLYLMRKKFFVLLPLFVIILFFIIPLTLEDLTGRLDVIEASFATRWIIFIELLKNSNFFSTSFGYATNTGILLSSFNKVDYNAFIADSTYTSILSNLGLITFIFVIFFIIISAFLTWLNKDKELLIFITIFTLYSATIIVFEAYPMNLLFAVLAAYYLRNYKIEKLENLNNPQ